LSLPVGSSRRSAGGAPSRRGRDRERPGQRSGRRHPAGRRSITTRTSAVFSARHPRFPRTAVHRKANGEDGPSPVPERSASTRLRDLRILEEAKEHPSPARRRTASSAHQEPEPASKEVFPHPPSTRRGRGFFGSPIRGDRGAGAIAVRSGNRLPMRPAPRRRSPGTPQHHAGPRRSPHGSSANLRPTSGGRSPCGEERVVPQHVPAGPPEGAGARRPVGGKPVPLEAAAQRRQVVLPPGQVFR